MQVTANWELPVYQDIGPVIRVHWEYSSAVDDETGEPVWTCQEAVVPLDADRATFVARVNSAGGDGEGLAPVWFEEEQPEVFT